MSDSSRPHGPQPTRLPRPWDFPGKRTATALKSQITDFLELGAPECAVALIHLAFTVHFSHSVIHLLPVH